MTTQDPATPKTVNSMASNAIELLLKRDRLVVIAGVFAVVAVAWAYIIYLDRINLDQSVGAMGMASANIRSWSLADFWLMFLMWAVMMTAMMVPTAAPMILLFASVYRKRREKQQPYVATSVFLAGYILVWSGFAALATLGNWGLHQASLMSSMMGESTSSYLGGGLLLAAGVFQWSRLKYVCLNHCRSPIGYVMSSWREGRVGALRMGMEHGAFCLGCCWVLMSLLFVLGVMNLLWIAGLAVFVLAEKIAPQGERVSRATGLLLVAWGAWTMLNGAF
jgi:predicted metal-binding membrane protein